MATLNSYTNTNNYILNLSGNNGTSRVWFGSNGFNGLRYNLTHCISVLQNLSNLIIRLEASTTSGFLEFHDTRLNVHPGGGYMSLIAGATERMRFWQMGNIGVEGVTTPNAPLHFSNLIKKNRKIILLGLGQTMTMNFTDLGLTEAYCVIKFLTQAQTMFLCRNKDTTTSVELGRIKGNKNFEAQGSGNDRQRVLTLHKLH